MKKPLSTVLKPLSSEQQAHLQRLLAEEGELGLSIRFGIGRGTLPRAAAGMPLTSGSQMLLSIRLREDDERGAKAERVA